MQFLKIYKDTTLSDLSAQVGSRNVSAMLVQNQVERTVNIGEAYYNNCEEISRSAPEVPWQRKQVLLNKYVDDKDIFETAALLGESAWKVLNELNSFPTAMSVPETVSLPNTDNVLGGGSPVDKYTYDEVMKQLADEATGHRIDPSVFNLFSSAIPAPSLDISGFAPGGSGDLFSAFKIPWGEVTLVNTVSQESIDFPAYPEELEDKRTANYTTMPDILYQYEPWQVYQSSGPRSATYNFDLHRQMWSGDESDGRANELIRFCQAFLYPSYSGSAVNTANATLYIAGQSFISGIITDVTVNWDGPLSKIDNFYLHFKIAITFTEVSTQALNYDVVRQLPLIG